MVFNILDKRIRDLIERKGFLEPTLAQKLSIEPILEDRNVLVIAPTGIGKTESAILPVFHKILQNPQKPIALLYLTPLKSLNRDLLDRMFWWADKLDLDIAVRHGDTTQSERASQREAPPKILISTPETLQAVLPGKVIRNHLSNIKYVVIDEIHELVESKRGAQLSLALERLKKAAGDFQRIGLSATVGDPDRVASFLGKNVKIIRAEQQKKYDVKVESPKATSRDRKISEDLIIGLQTTSRLRRLYDLMQSHKSVIAFTNTRETAEVLSSRLRGLDREFAQEVHHGSLSKERRVTSEQKFKSQELRSLVATSSLELGIDVGSIDLVVQYLSPRQVSRLIQRVGRSGHSVGATSRGVILSGDEDLFESTVIANRAMRKELEDVKIHEGATDILAMQIIGLAIDDYGIDDRTVFKIIKQAYPYRNMTKKHFDRLVRFLADIRLLWIDEKEGGYAIKRRRKAWTAYFENLSTIPDTVQYRVVSVIEQEPIGKLDEAFVAEHGSAGNCFVVAGRAWKILSVDGDRVIVEPIDDIESAIPAWEGELIPVPFEVAQEVGKLRRYIAKNLKNRDLAAELRRRYHVDMHAAKEMFDVIKKQASSHIIPDTKNFLIENHKDFIIIHSCCGSLVNATLGRYLSAKLSRLTGVSVNLKSDPYRIMLQTIAKKEIVRKELEQTEDLQEFLTAELERSSMFKWRFLHVARRFGIVTRRAKFDKINMKKIIEQYANSPVYEEAMRELQHDKMDFLAAEKVVEDIRNRKIKLHESEGLSILAELGLVQQFSETMKPRMPEKEIFQAFKKRLLATRVRLLCIHCGKYNVTSKVREVVEQPECPKCGSRLIAVLRKRHLHGSALVKKHLEKKKLTGEDKKELAAIRRTADLTIVYGKRAVIALAGRGLGPQTAARVLAMMHEDEDFYKDILEAEKQFARTKIYWK